MVAFSLCIKLNPQCGTFGDQVLKFEPACRLPTAMHAP
jgi:hypothetical protein